MKEASFTNVVEMSGQKLRMNELSEEKRKQISVLLSDRCMETAGFRRQNA